MDNSDSKDNSIGDNLAGILEDTLLDNLADISPHVEVGDMEDNSYTLVEGKKAVLLEIAFEDSMVGTYMDCRDMNSL